MSTCAPMGRLLRPNSIAVFGGAWAHSVITQSRRMGFNGEIWPVHPSLDTVEGHKCFRSVEDLPAAPDASFIGVNRELTVDIVRQLARRGSGGAVCFASGFSESGERGAELQAELIEAAGDMPVVGPNCYGYINYLDGALLWPDLHGGRRVETGVAIVAQSSNVAINLTMNRRSLDIAYVVALGNQAKVGLADMIIALSDDPRVTAIGLYIEGITDAAAFADASIYARRAGKSIVALKVGRSDRAMEMAMSHTASLSGADEVVSALFNRLGIARVNSLSALIEALKLLHVVGPLTSAEIVSMSCSGGEASIMADSASGKNISFYDFEPSQVARIRSTVNPLVTISNPFDYHTFDWGNQVKLQQTFEEVMLCRQALTALILDYPKAELGQAPAWDASAAAIVAAAHKTGGKAAVISTVHECMPEDKAAELHRQGIVTLNGIDDALAAIEAAAFIGTSQPDRVCISVRPGTEGKLLTEWDAKQRLRKSGVPIPLGYLCHSREEAHRAVEELGTAAVKAVGTDLVHKTELGAVALNVDCQEVRATFDHLITLGDAVLVEQMIQSPAAELIVGFVRDSVIGMHMLIGTGGTAAEILKDTEILLLPSDRKDIEGAIRRLQLSPLLFGWRGRPLADVAAAIDAILAMQSYVIEHLDTVHEAEMNPLIVCAEGNGAYAVDAVIRVER